MKLNQVEKGIVLDALKFYVYEVTHDPEDTHGCAGLPEGKEKEVLVKVISLLGRKN